METPDPSKNPKGRAPRKTKPSAGKTRKGLPPAAKAGLVFVTASLHRAAMLRHLDDISWESEVWVAESPTHLIHFNSERFLGPYEDTKPAKG